MSTEIRTSSKQQRNNREVKIRQQSLKNAKMTTRSNLVALINTYT